MTLGAIRHNWTIAEVAALDSQTFADLVFQAQQVHRQNFDPNEIQISTLLSIKTGACPEDCKYCSQSGHYKTAVNKEKLLSTEKVVAQALQAKQNGASRFCMGAAWRSPPTKDFPAVLEMVSQVKALGLETCLTAGMLQPEQAAELKSAGLDYYNHNLDTSPEYYPEIVSTHSYQERLDTLTAVADAGINTCCGGILGMGETQTDRYSLLVQLANLEQQPKSVPINILVPIAGTPLGDKLPLDPITLVRIIAIARIMLPKSYIRLSAGRCGMNEAEQALCFLAGANSFFYGEKLLTTPLPATDQDQLLLRKLGMKAQISANEVEIAEHA